MNAADQIKMVLIAGPILGLITLGFFIALRSGVATLSAGHGLRLVFENFSKTVLILLACALSMALLHLMMDVPLLPA